MTWVRIYRSGECNVMANMSTLFSFQCLIAFSSSMLSIFAQYQFCTVGVALGGAYAIRMKKGPAPMIVAGVGGTMADLFYAYAVACKAEVRALNGKPRDN